MTRLLPVLGLALVACSGGNEPDEDSGLDPQVPCEPGWDVSYDDVFFMELSSLPGGDFAVVREDGATIILSRVGADGSDMWTTSIATTSVTAASEAAATDAGDIFVGATAAGASFVQQFDEDGSEGWRFDFQDTVSGVQVVKVATLGNRVFAQAGISTTDFTGIRIVELDNTGAVIDEWQVSGAARAYTWLDATPAGLWVGLSDPNAETKELYNVSFDASPVLVETPHPFNRVRALPDGRALVSSWIGDTGSAVDIVDASGNVEHVLDVGGPRAHIFGTAVHEDGRYMVVGEVRDVAALFEFGDGSTLVLSPELSTGYTESATWGLVMHPDGTIGNMWFPPIASLTGAFRGAFTPEGEPVVSGFYSGAMLLPSGPQSGPGGYLLATCTDPIEPS